MLTFASFLIAASASAAQQWRALGAAEKITYTFDDYVAEFGSYSNTAEATLRRNIFVGRIAAIHHHNADQDKSYTRGVNQFTDRTIGELQHVKGLDKNILFGRDPGEAQRVPAAEQPHADALDWREKGVVTPVKNQGQCGSCWTFASTETIESHSALATGKLEELSEQFILDCTPNPKQCGGTGGCAGGTAELAYARLKELNGIPSEWTYPYISGTGSAGTCHGLPLVPEHPHSGGVMAAANVTGFVATETNSYSSMMDAIARGPVAISVDAGAWHDYESGVFDGGNKTNPDLDHLVQLVGYGTGYGLSGGRVSGDYWTVRNSWTPLWGINGYIHLARSATPSCGTDITPLDGNGCKGGPANVKVCGQSGVLYDGVQPLVK